MTEPVTPEQWQEAVNAADHMLLVEAAQRYGLIVGADGVNVERCVELLDAGADRGIFPSAPERRRVWLARWLASSRAALGVSQAELAGRVGVSLGWIASIEREQASCDHEMWARCAAAFETLRKERTGE